MPAAAVLPRGRENGATAGGSSSALNASSDAAATVRGGDDDESSNSSTTTKAIGSAAVALLSVVLLRSRISHGLTSALAAYESSLVTNPLPTKVLTGASLAVLGDWLAQAKERKGTYDVPRAVSFAVFDSCYRMFQHVAIPVIVATGRGKIFLSILSKLPFLKPTVAFTAAMERTFLYQFVLIPFFYYPIFFTFTGAIQGLSVKQTIDRARVTFLPCWKRNLLFWIPTQMVMFGLVAERWQIPFVCVMGILWSLILSVTAGKAKTE